MNFYPSTESLSQNKILGNKVYSTNTLKSWSKEELIKQIRIIENNWRSSLQSFENLSNNTKILLEDVEKSTKEKTVKEVLDQCTELMRRFEWGDSTDICMKRCEWEMNAERIAKDCFGVEWSYDETR